MMDSETIEVVHLVVKGLSQDLYVGEAVLLRDHYVQLLVLLFL